ncbi:hypothetical protein A3195_19835 [Candidatus Thiodiazotropha endoloripes]|uniref:Uncharacterized protein n=1 Tax=Candidatus Thiodiazotropha endoloripes TaxID=1818881 RepID=A0A1E2UH79_9GAMM|nr:hypothetical protein A3193_19500 [Candidatus Thiodiazotropha endoloripes]ODB82523.1 hypothetical protein A3195_19835 [Candidatus Thiodiazotropha endoloripes]ODB91972.1 hypothetical protein A3196_19820 [Candidatus Thiodiazotropha endoloripes]ODB94597.1 hypothetical protein A3194_20310 [Candidatus Thiodiazotropha endoloripes]
MTANRISLNNFSKNSSSLLIVIKVTTYLACVIFLKIKQLKTMLAIILLNTLIAFSLNNREPL